ncbi:hypothetical protein [Palleronia sp. LCG004]|uniref:hypothetical protein n=1 Tax=Palleronia sp. LCG004 TaxID=3079304 RepID=UPI0029439AC3|nr:hypothetical protein [Palleronia sp. LCG004]WOI55647.1 hypothetical protein RVY76_11430 [Palleronia sp. LCG004]
MRIIPIAALLTLTACLPVEAPPIPVDLPLLGPYRDEGDQCRRVGESAYTNQYLDDAADLVACPEDAGDLGLFVTETGGIEVDRVGGFVLYSVPRR